MSEPLSDKQRRMVVTELEKDVRLLQPLKLKYIIWARKANKIKYFELEKRLNRAVTSIQESTHEMNGIITEIRA